MEQLIYEIRPWAFVSLGLYCVVTAGQPGMLFYSGLLLAAAAALIIYARSKNRQGARF